MASDAVVAAQAVAGYKRPNVECKKATHATVERLLANDPDVAGLTISDTDDFMDLDMTDETDQQYKLAVIGRAISKNTHLRELAINRHRHGLKCFFNLLARNRSIEHLTINMVKPADADVDIISILAPFFEHNTNLRCIEIQYTTIACNASTFLSALSKSGTSRLERLCLQSTYFQDIKAAALFNALNQFIPGLRNLVDLDLGSNKIQRQGYMALSSLLMNSECRVHSLSLSHNQLDIESIGSLIEGLARNKYLKTLLIPYCYLGSTGWLIFMAFLSSPSCSLENIEIHDENINDQCAATLGNSLAVNEVMKSLQIYCRHITPTGWRHFFKFLQSPTTTLVDLTLNSPDINDEVAIYMFSALANNTSLKKLEMSYSNGITSIGWVECLRQLIGSKSALGDIIIDGCNIDDEGAAMLVHLISKHMRTVTNLGLYNNTNITAEGWRLFDEVLLPSSTSKLNVLHIGNPDDSESDDFITDDVALDIFAALKNNRSLQDLHFDQTAISLNSLNVLINILCNKTSIANTWQSNHTLASFGCSHDDRFPTELATLLELNKGKDKAEVARKKILLFSGLDEETVCNVFVPMSTTLVPTAIEWIGRDRLGFSAMYYLVQNVPTLLEYGTIAGSFDSAALESPSKRRKGG